MFDPREESSHRPEAWVLQFVEAYRRSRAGGGPSDLRRHLPDQDHVLYAPVLRALVYLDIEYGWRQGRPRRLADYRAEFPMLFRLRGAVQELALHEYKLRRLAGENATPAEYAQAFGIDTKDWPTFGPEPTAAPERHALTSTAAPADDSDDWSLSFDLGPSEDVASAARSYEQFRSHSPADDNTALDAWCSTAPGGAPAARLFRDLHRADPRTAARAAHAQTALPRVGDVFAGFRLVSVLGQGVFGRVYLARQPELADRYVALKVSAEAAREPERLARLQHTNIVPVYSVHRAEPFQAVCMPYLGPTSLAHVLSSLRHQETLPTSAKILMSTLAEPRPAPGGLAAALTGGTSPTTTPSGDRPRPEVAPELPRVGDASATLRMLEGLSYVQGVLWMGERLADGLAHAHERGVLHRDLKPANVLVTDDGQPMLLDFHVAEEAVHAPGPAAFVGGTVLYMSPEHLEAFQGSPRIVDALSDVYALGIILFELLTRRRPYPAPRRDGRLSVVDALRARLRPPPDVRHWNPAVTQAEESIVRHCLEPDPARRYQSAAELREDLERQRRDLPLRFAPDPSPRERFRKWRRRSPRLARAVLAGAAIFLVLGMTGGLAWYARRAALDEVTRARQSYEGFLADVRPVKYRLGARVFDAAEREAGTSAGLGALGRYRLPDDQSWADRPQVRRLPPEDQARLRAEVGELFFLLARAEAVAAASQKEPGRREALERARRLNAAARSEAGDGARAAVEAQRAELDALVGREGVVAGGEPAGPRDRFLLALTRLDAARFAEARDLLLESTRSDPSDVSAWMARGVCHDRLGEFARSIACYSAGIALWPEFHMGYYDRGLAHFQLGEYDLARADFDEAIRRAPTWPDSYIDRALTSQQQKQYAEALADLDRAAEHGAPACRVHFLRARVHELAGDSAAARQEREAGMRLKPTDELSWRARGNARLATDPAGALEDFERALALDPNALRGLDSRAMLLRQVEEAWLDRGFARVERDPKSALADFDKALDLNPGSWRGHMERAHALENLGRVEDAVAALGRAAKLPHENAESQSARGVLLARLGKRAEALADAKASMADGRPICIYRAACVYALTSRARPADRAEAIRLLTEALRRGFGLDYIEDDSDLDPLRKDPEFQRILQAARELKRAPKPAPKPKADTTAQARPGASSRPTDVGQSPSGPARA